MAREIFDFVLTFVEYKYILISEVRKTQIKQSEVIIMKNTVYEIEIERRNVTPRQFWTYCKNQLAKKGIEPLTETFEDFARPAIETHRHRTEDGCTVCVMPFEYQMYAPKAYNFIMEFEYYDGKTGFGYLYAVEYE